MVTPASDRPVVLLGPQRLQQSVSAAVADLGLGGPLAVVTAGWEEREHEDSELARDLGGRTRNLGLFPRAEEVYVRDEAVHSLMLEREDRLRQLQDLYRLRLSPQLEACRTLLERTDPSDPDELHGPEIDSAIDGLRALDLHHLHRTTALEHEIDKRLAELSSPVMDSHRSELAELLDGTEALLLAGGNVATLLRVLRLFCVIDLSPGKPVVAWSAGAMALGRQVVLFHDSPPQGRGDPELYGPGLGLVDGVLPLPHARHRLRLDHPARVALLARRFDPSLCVALDYGGRIDRSPDGETWLPSGAAAVLRPDGAVMGSTLGRDLPAGGADGTGAVDEAVRSEGDGGIDLSEGDGGIDPTGAPAAGCSAADIIESLTASARRGPAALDRALESMTVPVVGDGWVVYVYRGEARAVELRHWMSGLPSARPFRRIAGTDLWLLETEIQRYARIEYKLEILTGAGRELIRDPLNETSANDPFGANSVVQGPGYVRPAWTIEQPTARRGSLIDGVVESAAFGEPRPYTVYLPARFRATRRYPLLVVHDGMDYVQYASLATVLDNLIHRLEIPPLVAALIQSPNRTVEYGADERHTVFVADELLPELEGTLPLLGEPAGRGLLGASFGAVASLNAAWARPGTFGKLLLQSGSFAFTDIGDHDLGPAFDPVVAFVNRFRETPRRPADEIFLSAGIYEKLVYFNRSLLPALQGTGAAVRLVESQDGHNWENWRDQLRVGLTWLFPGPLWMVYE